MLSNTIKQVRLMKGLSQKAVANGYLSQGNYSKFENGTIEIPASAMIGILNNLDLELEELIFIDNGYKYSEKERIYREFFRTPVKNQISLENLVTKCDNYLAHNTDTLIMFIRQISLFLIDSIKNSDIYFNKEQAKYLLGVFSKKEHLYIKDLYIINSIFFLFPIETAHLTMEYIETALKKYGDFQAINRMEVNLRMNYSLMLMKENLEEKALQQLNITLPLVKNYKFSVQMGILYIRMGICLQNLKKPAEIDYIKKGIAILEVLEETELLTSMTKEINLYLKY
jgi:transcriptional regulator with XRE-family HTH domain